MKTLTDLDYLALTIYGEARNQPLAGKAAVAAVVRNRLHVGRWGQSYESVCLAPLQFSCWSVAGGRTNANNLTWLTEQIQLDRLQMDAVLAACYWVAAGCITGPLPDETKGATHYFVTGSPIPAWARGHVPAVVIGAHSFFNDVK